MMKGLTRAAIAAVLFASIAACKSSSYESEGDQFMRDHQFSAAYEAYRLAEHHGGTGDKTLTAKIREAYLASQVATAQNLIFTGEYVRANEILQQLSAEAPESPTVQFWYRKSEKDLSRKLTEDGKERMGVREYAAAIELFEKALRFDPQNRDAKDTLDRAKTIQKWRAEKGELLWKGGLRAISEGLPEVAESKLSAVEEYTSLHADVGDYLSEVRTVVGDNYYRMASSLEKDGQWFAALEQYKKAKTYKASPAGIDDAIARVEKEVKADQLVNAGKSALARDEFDSARDKLKKAFDMTTAKENRIAIEAALAEVSEKQNATEHQAAVDLELEGKLAESIEAFRRLDQRAPAFNDTRERIDRLTRQLTDAIANYKDGLAKFESGDILGARAKLKAALFLQPFMPEARAKLKEVDAAIAAQKK